ncbi:amine oxidase [Mucilaginibacter sp.]|uniref:amine oxidase n=1 Tax=Mucilaginibacter sp. TaxID=1882438 RepID=UPI003AFFA487
MNTNPFRSFWMAGYECTDQMNYYGDRVDLLTLTGHYQLIDQDYKDLAPFNIKTVREGIRWSKVEKRPYEYDWTAVAHMIQSGKANGIQQLWDICHFGYADDLSPLHPKFADRFEALCRAFVTFYRSVNPDETLIVTPINEVSFISWLGGDEGATTPYAHRQGWDVKYALMRAYIRGIVAMREVDPSVRIMTTEPLVQIVPEFDATEEEIIDAKNAHESQYQAVDILAGRLCPELGGSPDYLDILGFNYYYNNQWTRKNHHFMMWIDEPLDVRFRPFSSLMTEAYHRYQRPVVLSETSHPAEDRPKWIKYVADESAILLQNNIPFWGVCIYPIIDRPDWDHPTVWHHSGLWDAEFYPDELPRRVLYREYADALLAGQAKVAAASNDADYQ